MSKGCPMCNGPGVPLGSLGRSVWYRCRNCGWDFNRVKPAPRPKPAPQPKETT